LTQFTDLGLAKPILKALAAEGYTQPTPIQAQAIPFVLAGRDLLGIAQTGTGKTAAFALPILQRLADNPRPAPRRGCRVLVLSPTRELASQIAESFRAYGKHMGVSVAVVFGGAKYGPQVRALAAGVDILVATPGRLIDHLGERTANLGEAEVLVLDEADQMLDLGFLQPIRRIVSHLPKVRQNLFFSATMPGEIGKLAGELLNDPAKVSVAPQATTVEKIRQHLIFVEGAHKRELLAELFADPKLTRTIVFTRTKRGADRVAKHLETAGIDATSIHGDKSQGQRERALAAFKAGHVRALVATDIAARGIDVDAVSHIINFELPNVPETYVHRIGRTARAGAEGSAISLCSDDERGLLRDIEKLTRQSIPSTDRRRDRSLALMAAANGSAGGEDRQDKRPRGQQPRGRNGGNGGGNAGSQPPRRPQANAGAQRPASGQPRRGHRSGRSGGAGRSGAQAS
jgi:ATP-dependent RNA helicase RhlE